MNMTTIRLTILCCLLGFLACAAIADDDYWVYRSISEEANSPEIVIDGIDGRLSVGDLGVSLNVCSGGSAYVCFGSEFLSFAVPRDLSEISKTWVYDDVEYFVQRYSNEMLLGQDLNLYIINAKSKNNNLVYYYSTERGLIGIGNAKDKGQPLLSVDYCGFGPLDGCASPGR